MSTVNSTNPAPISFLDIQDFLTYNHSYGRLEKVIDTGLTLSAEPDDSGGTRWAARKPDGTSLPGFRLAIKPVSQTAPGSKSRRAHRVILPANDRHQK